MRKARRLANQVNRLMGSGALAFVLASALAGCRVGPAFVPDRMALPATFAGRTGPVPPEEQRRTEASLRHWWSLFGDPVLDRLVDQAIRGNYDLQVAAQRIVVEQALRREVASSWYPQLDLTAGGGDDRYSIAVDNWPLRPGNPANHPNASVLTYGAQARWEIDLFGHIARQVEAQDHNITVSVEDRRALLVALVAELASDYVALRGVQAQLDAVEHGIEVAAQTTDVTRRLYATGLANSLAVAQVAAQQRVDEARRPPLLAQQARLIHGMAILTGTTPETRLAGVDERRAFPVMPAFPGVLPSQVLAQRPDVRAGEARYAAATARIGVAIADLYPKFSIPLTFNPNASAFYQAFQLGAMSWSVMMMATLPVMHGGRYTAAVVQARAEAEAMRLAYRQTVLDAFREVEDAMSDWQQDNELAQRYDKAVEASVLARERAQRRFRAGLTNVLDVLVTERKALHVKEKAALARAIRLQAAVSLYRAIGAGWQEDVSVRDASVPLSPGSNRTNPMARAQWHGH